MNMDWNDVWKIALGVVAGFGGIGGIVLAIVKFSSNIIAERLSKKYELKLQKELENYRTNLDNKIYISKTKFDAEFELYRQLSKAFFDMVKDVTIMIPAGYSTYPADPKAREEYEDNTYRNASKSTVSAQDILNSNIPFLPEKFYEEYHEILKLCRQQLDAFEQRWNVYYLAPQEDKKSFSKEDYQRSRDINTKFRELNNDIRKYLMKLDVMD